VSARSADAGAAYARYLGTSHFGSLDGLRFLSIVPVVWHHSTARPLEGILGRGPLGVDLFFCISGFLITTLMIRERESTGRIAIGRFYARRSLRIFPLYYVVLSLYVARAALFLPAGPQREHFFRSLPFYATYTSNWFVDFAVPFPIIFSFAWSLATEEQFYAFWPWIMARARWVAVPVAVASLLLITTQCVQWGLLTSVLGPGGLARRIAGSVSSPMCMGILLSLALHERRSFGILWRSLGWRWSAPFLLGALLLLAGAKSDPLLAIRLTMTLLVGACCIRPDHRLAAFTHAPWVRWIGKVSYGIYLLHVAAVTAARHILPDAMRSAPLVFVVAFGASVAAASASYRWLEQPFLRMRDLFRTAPPDGVAYPLTPIRATSDR
jgi:peptidoglycan/LPS O-acetylase OafA/YrhL